MDEINRRLSGLPLEDDTDQAAPKPEPMTASEWFDAVVGRRKPEAPAADGEASQQ